jgi:prepilin-type N-terminal cleavage/methylation domain-containing protein/prepilin-type processing-associated H-X9-DG protein
MSGFTLVELLVVIAIIGILVGLLLPAVQSAREAARRLSCTNNLTQIALAIQNYEMTFQCYPAGTAEAAGPIVNTANGYHHNWLTQLLPYLEESVTYDHIDFSAGVYDAQNATVRTVRIPVYRCPSDWESWPGNGLSNFAGLHHDVDAAIDDDNNGVFFLNSFVRYDQITDGSSHTIFVGEKCSERQADLGWMSGTRWTLRNTGVPINQGANAITNTAGRAAGAAPLIVGGFGSHHPGGSNFAFGDGHIGFIGEQISLELLQQYGHRSDGKLLMRDGPW